MIRTEATISQLLGECWRLIGMWSPDRVRSLDLRVDLQYKRLGEISYTGRTSPARPLARPIFLRGLLRGQMRGLLRG
jgi:hypothetical protein